MNLDLPVSLSALAFSTTGTASYVVSSSSGMAITLANTSGAATIDNSGSNAIGVAVALQTNLAVNAAPGSLLTIAGSITDSGSGYSLTVAGGGESILSGTNSYGGGTFVEGGTLIAANPGGACRRVEPVRRHGSVGVRCGVRNDCR